MKDKRRVVFSKNTVEFVTVAAEYCAYIEQSEQRRKCDFVSTMLKLLPLLYLKASMMEPVEGDEEFLPEAFLSEADYEFVRLTLAGIMGDDDDYLDFNDENVRFNDEVMAKTVSEDLSDIYQALKNFVETYKLGMEEHMYEAVTAVHEAFDLYWGQDLVNAMRALHKVKNHPQDEEEDECEDPDCDCGHHHCG